MIHLLGRVPRKITVAFSGGVDSVVVTDFFLNGRKDVSLAFFHHGTEASDLGETFVKKFAEERRLDIKIGRISAIRAAHKSLEEHWRDERYSFLSQFETVVTGHHLDDAVETWVFTSLHGEPRIIPPIRGNVIRPFLLTPKSTIIDWAQRRGLEWIEDPSNNDTAYMRNLIRHEIVPHALKVNPGLRSVIRKKYLKY